MPLSSNRAECKDLAQTRAGKKNPSSLNSYCPQKDCYNSSRTVATHKLPNTDFPNLGEIYKMLYSISGNVRDNMCERYPTLEFYKEYLIHHLTQVG